jgi:methionyl-tRNA synthetase
MDKSKFYLTTTLPYVNAELHIGHALEFVQADTIVRYFRNKLGRENVFFNVGTDEHGQKIFNKAREEGLEIKDFVDKYAKRVSDFCDLFFVSYDNFYRTSDPRHHEMAKKFWSVCQENGDIYKKEYTGLYCVGCERYLTEKELVDGKCPIHGTIPEQRTEENYFLKLSKYREHLLNWLEENKTFVKPVYKMDELKKFISEAEDISISRLKEKLPWGIEVPDDPSQMMYVWFDALSNYVIAVGYGYDEERFNEWWPAVQICGPDNLRFQGEIWQGMLASAHLPHTKKLLVHGMILGPDGLKMSKSVGNVISPFEQEKKYGAEVVRFYLLTGIPTYDDAAYKEDDLVNEYNSRLANNFGNLLNRVIHLANAKDVVLNDENLVEKDFKEIVDGYIHEINNLYESYEIYLAAEKIDVLADFGNKYITKEEPWNKEKEDAEKVLNNLSYLLGQVIAEYSYIIPISGQKAKEALTNREKIILFPKI